MLYIETDYFSGSVGVDWLQVAKVQSTANYQVVLSDGKRLTGYNFKRRNGDAAGAKISKCVRLASMCQFPARMLSRSPPRNRIFGAN